MGIVCQALKSACPCSCCVLCLFSAVVVRHVFDTDQVSTVPALFAFNSDCAALVYTNETESISNVDMSMHFHWRDHSDRF